MKQIVWLEQLGFFLIGLFLCVQQPLSFSWYVWLLLFFAPDLGMLGYLINPAIGAFTYNLFHHFGLAAVCLLAGAWLQWPGLYVVGCVIVAHIGFDRMMGYGLKYADDFKHTHLGWIGKNQTPRE